MKTEHEAIIDEGVDAFTEYLKNKNPKWQILIGYKASNDMLWKNPCYVCYFTITSVNKVKEGYITEFELLIEFRKDCKRIHFSPCKDAANLSAQTATILFMRKHFRKEKLKQKKTIAFESFYDAA